MFYRGQLCELDFQILDHKQIYATGIVHLKPANI